jgi:hypothetical protein
VNQELIEENKLFVIDRQDLQNLHKPLDLATARLDRLTGQFEMGNKSGPIMALLSILLWGSRRTGEKVQSDCQHNSI